MQNFRQAEDLVVIGTHVEEFPVGIKDAFDSLIKTLGPDRNYYGVSWMDADNTIQYYAMAD
ncbi:MAG TPA: hypothetical protein VLC28_15370, partial [Flavitalea sp.]|nr:hypothetical protein [Flavitalea sp.]